MTSINGLGLSKWFSYYQNQVQSKSNSLFGNNYGLSDANTKKLQSIMENRQKLYESYRSTVDEFNKTSTTFYNGLYDTLGDLKASSSELRTYTDNSVIKPTGYGSSADGVVSVTKTKENGTASLDIAVKSIAAGEVKTSDGLDSKAVGQLAGMNSITINYGDKVSKVNVNIDVTATNKEAITKIAAEVNKLNGDVVAKAVEKDGKTTLALEAKNTGAKSTFSVEVSGRAEDALKLKTTQTASDAAYSVDGVDYTSETNQIKLQDGNIEATLKGAGSATIAPKVLENSKIVDAVKEFAKDFNNTVDYLNQNSKLSLGVQDLAYSFKATTRFGNSQLASIGISADGGGKLTVNEKTLKSALETDPKKVQSLLSDYGGLAQRVNEKATAAYSTNQELLNVPKIPVKFNGLSYYDANKYNSANQSNNNSKDIYSQYQRMNNITGLLMDTYG